MRRPGVRADAAVPADAGTGTAGRTGSTGAESHRGIPDVELLRRIRRYFGSEANIASAALTIGDMGTTKGWLCGYYLRLAGKSGVEGLQASEGYSNSPAPEARPAWCVIHALRELYLLQLETV